MINSRSIGVSTSQCREAILVYLMVIDMFLAFIFLKRQLSVDGLKKVPVLLSSLSGLLLCFSYARSC